MSDHDDATYSHTKCHTTLQKVKAEFDFVTGRDWVWYCPSCRTEPGPGEVWVEPNRYPIGDKKVPQRTNTL